MRKSELEDATKAAAVADFPRSALDPAYVDRMLDARYTRHFYTDAERAAMRRRYVR